MATLAGMRLFLRVVQTGSFSGAGRQTGLSPASVFRAINALEDSLGARLFNRSSRKLTLTETGVLYAGKVEHILNEVDEANGEVSQLQGAPKGLLRVHTRVSLGIHHLGPLLPPFLARHPELRIDLRLSDQNVDLIEDNIDVAIRVGEIRGASLVVRRLATSPRVLCASPGYLARHKAPEEPRDLLDHNCLAFRPVLDQPIWRLMRRGELTELRVTGTLHADSSDVLRTAALAGVGLVVLPAWQVGKDIEAGHLVPLMTDYEATAFGFDAGIYVVTHQARHRSAKVRLFLEFLATALKERLAWEPPAGGLSSG